MNSVRRILGREKPLVRVLPLFGTIAAKRGGAGKSLNITSLEKQIEQAFDCKKEKPKAVVLNINSSGGSAVQSNLIYQRIRNLAEKTSLPVISFIEDSAVSGGYWLALAGDEIHADPNSAVGSIGVLSMMFGVEEALKKIGLEPRLIKAGKHKMRINPFQPENPEDIAWVTDFMSEVHNNFKKLVRERRKSLDLNHKTVFEADIFSGQNAMKIGLIDGLHSDMNKLLKDRYGESVVIRRMEPKSKFPFGLDKFGAEVKLDTDNLLHSVSEASMVPRYKFF